MVKVSVGIITYNQEAFIKEAVSSALIQETDFEYEIVVGDDCSTDGTRNILLELQEKYPEKIKLHQRSENLGMLRNFARVLLECQGTYIALLEGDDYWTDTKKLQKQIDYLDSHPGSVICFHDVVRLRNNNIYEPWPRAIEKKETYVLEDLLPGNFIPTCSVVFRTGIVGELPCWYFDMPMGDWPLYILNTQYGDIGFLDEIMAVHRLHSASVWTSKSGIEQREKTLAGAKVINDHLLPEQRPVLQSTIVKWEHEYVGMLLANREIWHSFRTARECIKSYPFPELKVFWFWMKSFVRGYFPRRLIRFYYSSKKLKKQKYDATQRL